MKSSVLCCIALSSIFLFDFVYSEVTLSSGEHDGETAVTFSENRKIEITCKVSSDDKKQNVEIEWKQNGVSIEDVDSLKDRYTISSKGSLHKLEIKEGKEADIGEYACVTKDDKNDQEVKFHVFTKPVVKVPSNVNVVEFEKLKILCNVFGKPASKVAWFYTNDTNNFTKIEDLEEVNERIKLETDPEKHVENAILIIEGIQMYEKGEYTCMGYPPFGSRTINDTTTVRIKGKYAALWPFIGICAEVFVLCAIILIYEKKRNKTDIDESDTDQSPDQKNTPDHNKDSNLRHRQ